MFSGVQGVHSPITIIPSPLCQLHKNCVLRLFRVGNPDVLTPYVISSMMRGRRKQQVNARRVSFSAAFFFAAFTLKSRSTDTRQTGDYY